MANILIIEDEKSINNLIQKNLHLVGHQCYSMFDGIDADKIVREKNIDLVILDIMLPKIDGYHVYENINFIPVIFLTAKDSLQDKVKGLTLGADDYIVKPFELMELYARIENVLKRRGKLKSRIEVDECVIDLRSHKVWEEGRQVALKPMEYDLLVFLCRNRNVAFTRDGLLAQVWGDEYGGETRTVDAHISRIRKKLGFGDVIRTIPRIGYRLEADE